MLILIQASEYFQPQSPQRFSPDFAATGSGSIRASIHCRTFSETRGCKVVGVSLHLGYSSHVFQLGIIDQGIVGHPISCPEILQSTTNTGDLLSEHIGHAQKFDADRAGDREVRARWEIEEQPEQGSTRRERCDADDRDFDNVG